MDNIETEEKTYSVYCHTLPNNKKYIGISYNPYKRWRNGYGYIENEPFYIDILLYGWDNIQHEILDEGLTYYQAKQLEHDYIIQFNTLDPDYGYNRHPSGMNGDSSAPGRAHTKESIAKISESLKKYNAGARPKPAKRQFSEETKKRMSEAKLRLPKEELAKLGERLPHLSGADSPNAKAVIRIDPAGTEMYFDCITNAVKYMGEGYFRQGIIRCAQGKQKKYKGYAWKYANDKKEDL